MATINKLSQITLATTLIFSTPLAFADNNCVKPKIKGYSTDNMSCPSEGLVGVINDDNKVGYLDKNGRVVIPFIYDPVPIEVEGGDWVASPFQEGVAIVAKTQPHKEYGEINYYGFIDKSGKPIIPIKYLDAGNFVNGLAPVAIAGKKDAEGYPSRLWGYIDKSGKTVIPFNYDGANSFSEGLAVVEKNGKYGVINTQAKQVIPFKYNYIDNFSEGLAGVYKEVGYMENSDNIKGKFGYINKAGKLVIPMTHDIEVGYGGIDIPHFKNGKAKISKYQGEKDLSYCINKMDKKVKC